MKIDKSISEKMNLIKLTNATFDALEVTVDVPEDESKVTITELTEVGTGEDNGENTDIQPNTSVKVTFTDEEDKSYSTTLNFRRLDLSKKMEKDKVVKDPETGHILESSGVTEDWKVRDSGELITELTGKAKDVLGLGTDTEVSLQPLSRERENPTNVNKVNGTVNCKVNITNSLLVKTKDPIKVTVKVRPDDVGEILNPSRNKTKAFFSLTEHASFAEVKDIDNNSPYYGYLDGYVFLPRNIESIDGEWWKSARTISDIKIVNAKYPKLKRIEDNAFTERYWRSGYIRFNTSDIYEDLLPKTPTDHFLGNLDYIGERAMKPISFYLSAGEVRNWDSSITEENRYLQIGNENLYLGKEAFNQSSSFTEVKVDSLQALFRIIEDGYSTQRVHWTNNFDSLDELNQKQELDQNDTHGWFEFENGVKVFVTKDEMTQHNELFHPEENGTIPFTKLANWKLPADFGTTYESNFLRGLTQETLTIGNDDVVKGKAFAKAEIDNLIFSGETDTFNVEEGAFDGATITTITVKNNTVKEFISSKLNSLGSTPTYKVLEVSVSTDPVEEGEVPESIKADGFKHNEE